MPATSNSSPRKTTRKTTQPAFETALHELETIVETMERGNISLEESLAAFERGMKLLKTCQTQLANAEQRIQVLEQGELRDEPSTPESS